MNGIYLIIGGNIGNRVQHIVECKRLIEIEIGAIEKQSSIYETAAWGKTDEPNYLNQVLKINTIYPPELLLKKCFSIEKKMGRIRKEKWSSRTIDIDILFYHDEVIDKPSIKIPHPRIAERRFVLTPLNELAANEIFPSKNITISSLLDICNDSLKVIIYNEPASE